MNRNQYLLAALALGGVVSVSEAQTIARIDGEAASPGTLITIAGTGLASTTHIRFQADVGGFVGVWDQDEPVQSVSATGVTVLVPDIVAGFVLEGPSSGSPFGQLRAVDSSSTLSNTLPFYFFEGSGGFLANAGLGTTQSTGQGRSIISFDLAGKPPTSDNPNFTPTLHNAVPGVLPFLAVGLPGPDLPLDDGILAVNVTSLFIIAPGSVVDFDGNAALSPLPIPPIPPGTQLSMQWGYLDPATQTFELSNGMDLDY